jgi:uncharacterized protein YceH (UPF0502 family)
VRRYHVPHLSQLDPALNIVLTANEVRVLGCLIEKEATTPDVYPLTLNSLLTACNQKSSREPVMELTADDVLAALDSLLGRTLAATWQSGHNRTAKYKHRLHDRISDRFSFSVPELAVLGTLFLRGPQTVGEIRTRCARIHEFGDLDQVAGVLKALEDNPDGPYVKMLPRLEGRKEPRFIHLFCGEPEEISVPVGTGSRSTARGEGSRVEALELQVSELKTELQALEQRLSQFMAQFD